MSHNDETQISRRSFLVLTGAAALTAAVNPQDVWAAQSADQGEITILTWETYHEDPWIAEWSKATGIKVNVVRAGSNDEIFAQLQSGAIKADIIYIESGTIKRYLDAKLISPVDASKVINAKNITPGLKYQLRDSLNGKLYGIPYNWGTQPLVYNESVIASAPTSWAALWDTKYKGKVSLFDDAYITIPMVALYVGAKNPHQLTDKEYAECRKALKALRSQVRSIARGMNDQEQQFAQGEAVIGYLQNVVSVHNLRAKGKKVNYTFPKEGTPCWIDNAVLTPRGQRPAVYRFINDNLSLQWQGRFVKFAFNNGVLTETLAHTAGLSADVLKKTNIIDQSAPGFWDKMSVYQAPESIDRRVQLWNEFKAGTL